MTFVKNIVKKVDIAVKMRGCNCGVNYNPTLSKHNFTVDQKTCSSSKS